MLKFIVFPGLVLLSCAYVSFTNVQQASFTREKISALDKVFELEHARSASDIPQI